MRGGWALALAACSERVALPESDLDTGPVPFAEPADPEAGGDGDVGEPESACGETHEVDFTVSGQLVRPTGSPVADADVWLEQRDWGPLVVHGAGVTAADGRFAFAASAVPIVERCWAVGPQFWVIGAKGELRGEDAANLELVTGWLDGSLAAPLLQPLVTEY